MLRFIKRCFLVELRSLTKIAVWYLVLPVLLTGAPALTQSPSANQSDEDLARGKRLFEGQCARCHGMKGAGGTGPSLKRPILRHAADDEALFSVIKEGIPGTGMAETWQMSDREIRQVVSYVRSLGRKAVVSLTGDPERGKGIYVKGDCATCHIVRGQGGSLGPELSDIGARRGPDYVRKAVLHPGTEMALDPDGYTAFLVVRAVTHDGREVRGARINEDTFTIQLRDADNRYHSFRKGDLKELRREIGGSMMPSYEEVFSATEMDDLIAYLTSLRGEL